MDEKLTGFLTTEYRMGKGKIAPIDLLLLVATLVFGLLLRSKVWMIGGVIESEIVILGDMAPVMKGVSIGLDVLLAILSGYFVFLLSKSKVRGFVTYAIVFLLPPVVMASAMWGTGDGAYLSAVLISLIALWKDKKKTAVVSFILAALLHPYALFLLPLFLAYGAKYGFGNNKVLSLFSLGLAPLAGVISFLLRQSASPYLFGRAEFLISCVLPEKLLSYHFPNFYHMVG